MTEDRAADAPGATTSSTSGAVAGGPRVVAEAPDPAEAVTRAEGEPDGLAELYRSAHAEMVRLAFLLTSSEETAHDLVQDSFVRVHRHWSRIDEPRAYLRRTVVNACRSHHRRRYRERRHVPDRVEPIDLEADELSDALATLPYRQRAALVLRFYHDLSEREVAAVLRCRPGTVGSLVHRGLARLRKVIAP